MVASGLSDDVEIEIHARCANDHGAGVKLFEYQLRRWPEWLREWRDRMIGQHRSRFPECAARLEFTKDGVPVIF